jgi:hypothetical protein
MKKPDEIALAPTDEEIAKSLEAELLGDLKTMPCGCVMAPWWVGCPYGDPVIRCSEHVEDFPYNHITEDGLFRLLTHIVAKK